MEKLSVIIPCYNEALTIEKVISDFKNKLPDAKIFVFDNCSTDETKKVASSAGAFVIDSVKKGKGNVIIHAREVVNSENYIIIDGDDTYQIENLDEIIEQYFSNDADMLIGTRFSNYSNKAFRKFHIFGNKMISNLVSILFYTKVNDVLSGFRIIKRDCFKNLYLRTQNFEIETEMTIQAIAKKMKIIEFPVNYVERPAGSESKLNTFGDGILILKTMILIFKDYNPLFFYSLISIFFMTLSIISGVAPIIEFFETGVVTKVPRAILATGLGIISILSIGLGVILNTLLNYHNEIIFRLRN